MDDVCINLAGACVLCDVSAAATPDERRYARDTFVLNDAVMQARVEMLQRLRALPGPLRDEDVYLEFIMDDLHPRVVAEFVECALRDALFEGRGDVTGLVILWRVTA
jgi:hypothetical protein